MGVFFVKVDSLVCAVGVVSGSKGAGEEVDCMTDSMNVVVVVLDPGTVDWDLGERTSNPFLRRDPDPEFCPCPVVPGDDSHARDTRDVAEGVAVAGTLAGLQKRWPVCCVRVALRPVASSAGFSGRSDYFR